MKVISKFTSKEREFLERIKKNGYAVLSPLDHSDIERLIKLRVIELCENCIFVYKLHGTKLTINDITY